MKTCGIVVLILCVWTVTSHGDGRGDMHLAPRSQPVRLGFNGAAVHEDGSQVFQIVIGTNTLWMRIGDPTNGFTICSSVSASSSQPPNIRGNYVVLRHGDTFMPLQLASPRILYGSVNDPSQPTGTNQFLVTAGAILKSGSNTWAVSMIEEKQAHWRDDTNGAAIWVDDKISQALLVDVRTGRATVIPVERQDIAQQSSGGASSTRVNAGLEPPQK